MSDLNEMAFKAIGMTDEEIKTFIDSIKAWAERSKEKETALSRCPIDKDRAWYDHQQKLDWEQYINECEDTLRRRSY